MKHVRKWTKRILGSIASLIIGYIGLILCSYLLTIVIYLGSMIFGQLEYVESHSFDIYAIEDSNTYIVSRYDVNQQMRNYFVRKINGGYKTGYVSASNSIIYETDDSPKITVYREQPKYLTGFYNMLINFSRVKEKGYNYNYSIYVPRGTVKNEFNVDIK